MRSLFNLSRGLRLICATNMGARLAIGDVPMGFQPLFYSNTRCCWLCVAVGEWHDRKVVWRCQLSCGVGLVLAVVSLSSACSLQCAELPQARATFCSVAAVLPWVSRLIRTRYSWTLVRGALVVVYIPPCLTPDTGAFSCSWG